MSVDAAGWTFVEPSPIYTNAAAGYYTANLYALAPGPDSVTMTVAWAGATCPGGKGELGDEFAAADPAQPVSATATTSGTGDCTATIRTDFADEAVWAACFSATTLVSVGSGYTMGADDGGGDWAEYKLTTDPAGTDEVATYTNSNVAHVLDVRDQPALASLCNTR